GEVVEGARAAGGEARPEEEAEERDPVHVGRRAEEVARRCRHHDEDRDAGLEQLPQVSGTRTGGDGGHQFGFGGEGGGRGPHGRGGLRGWKLNARPPPPTVKRGRVWEREKGRKGEKGRPVAVASLSIFRAPTPPFFLSRPMPLIASISGIRGVFGDGLDPDVIVRYAAAFGAWCRQQSRGGKPLVVGGRDGRTTGAVCARLVTATLQSTGCDVVDAGLATTPTVAMGVLEARAAGAVILSASHNPAEWNALKLLDGR